MTGLTILTFNVWDLPVYWRHGRRQRMQKIAEYLNATAADIICLQEVWYRDTQRLFNKVLGTSYHCTNSTERQASGFNNHHGGLLIASKFPLQEIHFSPFAPIHLPLSERWAHKGVLEARITTPQGEINIFNTHLYQPRLDVRLEQFRTVLRILKKDVETPACLLGDFNQADMRIHSEFTAKLLAEGFVEPYPEGIIPFFTHRVENHYARTWTNRAVESAQLDYIYTRQFEKVRLKPVRYEALYRVPPLSDHDPVLLTCNSF